MLLRATRPGAGAICSIVALSVMFILESAVAQDELQPTLQAIRLEQAPQIDGLVTSDEAWSGVNPASGFRQVQPDDGQPATQRTEVYVGYTDDALYVAVMAHDDDPTGIIVSDSRRDSSLADTDAFLFVIDGMLDRQNGFVFGTNAAGVEYDGQITKEGASGDFGSGGGAFNLNCDGSWTVHSRITADGWSAEF